MSEIDKLSPESKKEVQLQLIKISIATEMLDKSVLDYISILYKNGLYKHSVKRELKMITDKCRKLVKSQNSMFDENSEEWAELLIYIDELFDKEIEQKVQVSVNGTVV